MEYRDEAGAVVERYSRHGVEVAAARDGNVTEYFLTAMPEDSHNTKSMFTAAANALRETGATIVSLEIFGVANPNGIGAQMLTGAFGPVTWPVTWIEEGSEGQSPRPAIQIWAVSGTGVSPVELNGKIVGSIFTTSHARYCRLGGLAPAEIRASNVLQARAVLELMEQALTAARMDFGNVVRTWFYNYKMLDWYDDFNAVRTQFFNERAVFDGLVPASTGVGGRNDAGAALMAECLAWQPRAEGVVAAAVPSPLQCPAPAYGSSFSRAVELETPAMRRLYVSGTASIALEGHSIHIGDLDRQIARTMEVVEAILESRSMRWDDITRAIGYFKHAIDCPRFGAICGKIGLPPFPIALVKNDICRDDLLFEIELDALKVK